MQPWAGGEHLDIESVAAASAIARTAELLDRQHALTTEIGNLRRDEIESAIAGDDLERPAFAMVPSRAAAVDVFQRVEALRTLKCLADQACHGGLTHSDAVAERAVRIATSMELDHDAVLAVQLAGELHEIGTLLGGEEELCDSAMVGLAGTMIRACGLPEAATIVESMHEQFDGSWIPLGRAGEKIPIGARILAVADDLETALEGRTGDAAIEAAVVRLQRGRGPRSIPGRAGRAAHGGAVASRAATVARVSATLIARSLAAGHGDRALFSGLDLVVAAERRRGARRRERRGQVDAALDPRRPAGSRGGHASS